MIGRKSYRQLAENYTDGWRKSELMIGEKSFRRMEAGGIWRHPIYGKWFGVELSAENKKQFYIPEGFAHGFIVLSDEAEFAYKCTDFYHPGDEGGLAYNDPEIGIDWPFEEGVELIISEKDKKWSGLKDTFKFNEEK
mgnify:CR=1 FL=1